MYAETGNYCISFFGLMATIILVNQYFDTNKKLLYLAYKLSMIKAFVDY